MRQYLDVKARYPDALVLFRLGDFYELFYDDAVYAARVLDLTLTTRDKGKEDPVPMCGVPHHAVRTYLAKLTELGHRVALCEQLEDPKVARGIVKRDVVRVITPGVVLDEEALDPRAPSYVAAAVGDARAGYGLALLDVTTGDFRITEAPTLELLLEEIGRAAPRELVLGRGDREGLLAERIRTAFPRLPRAVVSDGETAPELSRALGTRFDADAAGARAASRARGGGRPALCPRDPARRRAGPGRPGGRSARRHAGHRRAGARPPGAGRVAAGAAAGRVAHRSAGSNANGDGRPDAAAMAAVPVARSRPRSGGGRTRSNGWSARTPPATRRASGWATSRTSSGWSGGPAWASRRRAISPCSGGRWASCPRWPPSWTKRTAARLARPPAARRTGWRWATISATDLASELTRVLRPDAPALTKDGGYVNAGVSPELDELRDIAERRPGPHRRDRDPRARANRHPVAEDQAEQRLRLLHRGHALEPGGGAGRLSPQADGRQRRTVRHARAGRVRGHGADRRRAPRRAGAGAVHEAARPRRAPTPSACWRWRPGSRRPTRWRRWRRSRTATATAARRSTTAASSSCATRAIRSSSSWPPPAASSPTTSGWTRRPSRS